MPRLRRDSAHRENDDYPSQSAQDGQIATRWTAYGHVPRANRLPIKPAMHLPRLPYAPPKASRPRGGSVSRMERSLT